MTMTMTMTMCRLMMLTSQPSLAISYVVAQLLVFYSLSVEHGKSSPDGESRWKSCHSTADARVCRGPRLVVRGV